MDKSRKTQSGLSHPVGDLASDPTDLQRHKPPHQRIVQACGFMGARAALLNRPTPGSLERLLKKWPARLDRTLDLRIRRLTLQAAVGDQKPERESEPTTMTHLGVESDLVELFKSNSACAGVVRYCLARAGYRECLGEPAGL
jgi:hypothetical protein